MVQIVEVIVAMVVSALLAGSITALAITPIKTQRQKNNFAAAEALAIRVRQHVATPSSTTYTTPFTTDPATISNISNYNSLKDSSGKTVVNASFNASGEGCVLQTNYNPPASSVVVPNAVVCVQGSGSSKAQTWQPLYTVAQFNEQVGAGVVPQTVNIAQCFNKWLLDSNAKWGTTNSPPASAVSNTLPYTVNLNDAYVNECAGVTVRVTKNDDWANNRTPCKIEYKAGDDNQNGTLKVKYNDDNDDC